MIFTVCMTVLTVVAVHMVDKKDARLLGYTLSTVLSDSMKEEFQAGDIAVSGVVDPAALREGDIITFRSVDPDRYGEVITHKIREITSYDGAAAFITYGTADEADDPYPAPADRVIGQYRFRLPGMGRLCLYLKSSTGYITLIFLPFLLLLLLLGARFVRRIRQNRDVQQAEVAAERQKARRMMAELEQLRQRLGGETDKQEKGTGGTV